MTDDNMPVLYDVEDIQKIFKIGRTRAYQLMTSPAFPSIRMNRKIYVTKEKLEALRAQYPPGTRIVLDHSPIHKRQNQGRKAL